MEDYREIGPPGNGETRKTGASNLAAVRETTRHVRIHASRVIFRGAHKSLDQYRPASTLTQPPARFIPSVSCRVMRLPTSGQTSRPIPMFSKAALSQGEYWDLDRESRRVRRAGRKIDRFRRSRIPNCSVCRSLPVGGTHQVGRDPEHISRPFSEVSWIEVTCSAHGHDWTSRSLSRRRNGCTRCCAARRCNLQFQT